ncbi:MAG: HNH endonuclease [Candidatus Kryptoniota bacterium]
MPDREVHTIRSMQNEILACALKPFRTLSRFRTLTRLSPGVHTIRDLKSGGKSWSHIEREDWQLVEAEKKCVYCGSMENLQREHIVPKSLHIKPDCPTCDHIQSIHNEVWACGSCNSSKGTMGLHEFYHKMHPEEPKYFDYIPELVEKKYLKTILKCHECAGTLDVSDLNNDGELSVLDIDLSREIHIEH